MYSASRSDKGKQKSEESHSQKNLQGLLEALANEAIKEKPPDLEELEAVLHQKSKPTENNVEKKTEIKKTEEEGDSLSITKFLIEKGYLKDENNWITKKGFFEIGSKILNEIMKNLSTSELGFHETKHTGTGNVILDTTKKFEHGSDLRFLNVPHTLLNTIQRESKKNSRISFPLRIETDDFEEYETHQEVKISIVYCIDLSSTMKYKIGKTGKSRIEAAKKALWSLYVLNTKFFPSDSVSIIGFGSLASRVNPYDIPFLKTYDANDNFLHYTNYQAALKMARTILQKSTSENKRIVMITDGQPSACFVENEYQKNEIISEKPYSNFYSPEKSVISKVKKEKNMNIGFDPDRLVYLCYRYKKVDPKINKMTMIEAKKCKKNGIDIDTIVISDEEELFDYVKEFEQELKGRTYIIENENMDKVLVMDYLSNTRKVLSLHQGW